MMTVLLLLIDCVIVFQIGYDIGKQVAQRATRQEIADKFMVSGNELEKYIDDLIERQFDDLK